jgi:hypothetical protein
MAHVIELPEETFKRLQALARPLIDTPVMVIGRLLDHYEGRPQSEPPVRAKVHRFGPASAPDFTHTRVLFASFAGEETARPRWNELVRKAHDVALSKVETFDDLEKLSTANICYGTKTDDGFRPVADLGYSIQGVDANDAWRIAYDLARKLRCSVRVEFEWRAKDDAEFPGERGLIEWIPGQ